MPESRVDRDNLELETRYRLLVQAVADFAIYMLAEDGTIKSWNSGAERLKGYRAEEIIGKNFSQFFTEDDRKSGLPQKALATAKQEGRFESEGWRVRKDGSKFWASAVLDAIYDDNGCFVGFTKITRDLSERRATEEALRDSERRFRLLVNGVTDYALYMVDPQGIVTSWNAGAERIKKYRADEIIGQHFSRFYSEADRLAGKPMRALSIATQAGKYEEEGWRVRKDGSLFWASVVIDAIHDERGILTGFAKITRDITERRDAQIALEKIQAHLAEAQKMDALGQLTGGVAHDFNNLLMVVSGHILTLKRLVANDPKGARAVAAIELAAERGVSLTRQLLTFARRQQVEPAPVNIAERIDAFREMLTSGLHAGKQLVTDIPEGIWPVTVDAGEFEIALVNLVINARDAMPEGGTVTITAENLASPVFAKDTALMGDYVALSVSDTGVGIPDDVLGKIFDPFFTTKPVGKGTGLGLSQVYGFAHQAGGTVVVQSTLGKGTRLTLYLPRATEIPARPTAPKQDEYQPAAGRVLLVEDNPEVASASIGLLEQLGFSVRSVSSAEAALRALHEDDTIDLVFSDIVMPGRMDGLALARAIREEYPGLPVLLTTGYSQAALSAASEFSILRKPYQLAELNRAAAKLMGEKRRGAAKARDIPAN